MLTASLSGMLGSLSRTLHSRAAQLVPILCMREHGAALPCPQPVVFNHTRHSDA